MSKIYVGFDESNNGRKFEIHTAVFSDNPLDISESPSLIPKLRRHKNLFNRLRNRTYAFLLFTDSDRDRIPFVERSGVTAASLMVEEYDWSDFEGITLFLDGAKSTKEIDTLADIVLDTIPIPATGLEISFGPKYDQRIRLVNMADQLAHYLFKKGIDVISEHEDRKPLLY